MSDPSQLVDPDFADMIRELLRPVEDASAPPSPYRMRLERGEQRRGEGEGGLLLGEREGGGEAVSKEEALALVDLEGKRKEMAAREAEVRVWRFCVCGCGFVFWGWVDLRVFDVGSITDVHIYTHAHLSINQPQPDGSALPPGGVRPPDPRVRRAEPARGGRGAAEGAFVKFVCLVDWVVSCDSLWYISPTAPTPPPTKRPPKTNTQEMQDRGLPLTAKSLTAAVYALCRARPARPEAAEALMAEMEGTGLVAPDVWTWYARVSACGACLG